MFYSLFKHVAIPEVFHFCVLTLSIESTFYFISHNIDKLVGVVDSSARSFKINKGKIINNEILLGFLYIDTTATKCSAPLRNVL